MFFCLPAREIDESESGVVQGRGIPQASEASEDMPRKPERQARKLSMMTDRNGQKASEKQAAKRLRCQRTERRPRRRFRVAPGRGCVRLRRAVVRCCGSSVRAGSVCGPRAKSGGTVAPGPLSTVAAELFRSGSGGTTTPEWLSTLVDERLVHTAPCVVRSTRRTETSLAVGRRQSFRSDRVPSVELQARSG